MYAFVFGTLIRKFEIKIYCFPNSFGYLSIFFSHLFGHFSSALGENPDLWKFRVFLTFLILRKIDSVNFGSHKLHPTRPTASLIDQIQVAQRRVGSVFSNSPLGELDQSNAIYSRLRNSILRRVRSVQRRVGSVQWRVGSGFSLYCRKMAQKV